MKALSTSSWSESFGSLFAILITSLITTAILYVTWNALAPTYLPMLPKAYLEVPFRHFFAFVWLVHGLRKIFLP